MLTYADRHLDWYRYIAVSLQEARLTLHESLVLRCVELVQAVINRTTLFSSAAGNRSSRSRLLWKQQQYVSSMTYADVC